MSDPTSTQGEWRFDDLRVLYINCTLKRSPGWGSGSAPR